MEEVRNETDVEFKDGFKCHVRETMESRLVVEVTYNQKQYVGILLKTEKGRAKGGAINELNDFLFCNDRTDLRTAPNESLNGSSKKHKHFTRSLFRRPNDKDNPKNTKTCVSRSRGAKNETLNRKKVQKSKKKSDSMPHSDIYEDPKKDSLNSKYDATITQTDVTYQILQNMDPISNPLIDGQYPCFPKSKHTQAYDSLISLGLICSYQLGQKRLSHLNGLQVENQPLSDLLKKASCFNFNSSLSDGPILPTKVPYTNGIRPNNQF